MDLRLRVWDGEKMRNVGEIKFQPSISEPYVVFDEFGSHITEDGATEIRPESLMLYTGKNDKQGNEIWAGSTLKYNDGESEFYSEIYYEAGEFKARHLPSGVHHPFDDWTLHYMIVTGHIYDQDP